MPSEVKSQSVRAGAYARYSSDNQREASIEDQIEVCRRYAELQGYTVVEVYPDYALSGASRFPPAFQQMQVDADARRLDVIIVEALDRLSRKLADVADLHDRLTFLGTRLHAVVTGEVNAVHVGMIGNHGPDVSVGSSAGRSRAPTAGISSMVACSRRFRRRLTSGLCATRMKHTQRM